MWAEFTGLIVFAGSVVYAARPLVSGITEAGISGETAGATDDQKLRIYEALDDLEYDRQMKKISPADYAALERSLKREALEILAAARKQSMSGDRGSGEAKPACHPHPAGPADQLAVCPNCGGGVPADFHYCGQCGVLISAV